MIETLLESIQGYEADDFWYDVQSEYVEKILNSFNTSDWIELREKLPFADKQINVLILECLGNVQNSYALSCIEKIVLDADLDTLFNCALSLRGYDVNSISIKVKKILINKEKLLIKKQPANMAKLVEDFIIKLKES